jgi:ectoine hydroxylase-related dioxygenase (phytanoyl-CoA dioxygenase family)
VLPPEQVARMHADLRAHQISAQTNDPFRSRFHGYLDWGDDWRSLIDQERVLSVLRAIIGTTFRLDHTYGMAMSASGEKGGEGLHHHAAMFDYGCFSISHGERMHNGLVVVSYALADAPPGAGGFCCIPGTHKSLYPVPPAWFGTLDNPLIEHVPMQAGDALIFTESLTHGTMPWTLTSHERRSVLLKYTPAYMQWSKSPQVTADRAKLTPRQQAILAPAGMWERPPIVA